MQYLCFAELWQVNRTVSVVIVQVGFIGILPGCLTKPRRCQSKKTGYNLFVSRKVRLLSVMAGILHWRARI